MTSINGVEFFMTEFSRTYVPLVYDVDHPHGTAISIPLRSLRRTIKIKGAFYDPLSFEWGMKQFRTLAENGAVVWFVGPTDALPVKVYALDENIPSGTPFVWYFSCTLLEYPGWGYTLITTGPGLLEDLTQSWKHWQLNPMRVECSSVINVSNHMVDLYYYITMPGSGLNIVETMVGDTSMSHAIYTYDGSNWRQAFGWSNIPWGYFTHDPFFATDGSITSGVRVYPRRDRGTITSGQNLPGNVLYSLSYGPKQRVAYDFVGVSGKVYLLHFHSEANDNTTTNVG